MYWLLIGSAGDFGGSKNANKIAKKKDPLGGNGLVGAMEDLHKA